MITHVLWEWSGLMLALLITVLGVAASVWVVCDIVQEWLERRSERRMDAVRGDVAPEMVPRVAVGLGAEAVRLVPVQRGRTR